MTLFHESDQIHVSSYRLQWNKAFIGRMLIPLVETLLQHKFTRINEIKKMFTVTDLPRTRECGLH